jgi:arsenical-resistance protein 2
LREKGEQDIQSVALFEGIVGWVKAGEEYTKYVDEYVPEAWKEEHVANH